MPRHSSRQPLLESRFPAQWLPPKVEQDLKIQQANEAFYARFGVLRRYLDQINARELALNIELDNLAISKREVLSELSNVQDVHRYFVNHPMNTESNMSYPSTPYPSPTPRRQRSNNRSPSRRGHRTNRGLEIKQAS